MLPHTATARRRHTLQCPAPSPLALPLGSRDRDTGHPASPHGRLSAAAAPSGTASLLLPRAAAHRDSTPPAHFAVPGSLPSRSASRQPSRHRPHAAAVLLAPRSAVAALSCTASLRLPRAVAICDSTTSNPHTSVCPILAPLLSAAAALAPAWIRCPVHRSLRPHNRPRAHFSVPSPSPRLSATAALAAASPLPRAATTRDSTSPATYQCSVLRASRSS